MNLNQNTVPAWEDLGQALYPSRGGWKTANTRDQVQHRETPLASPESSHYNDKHSLKRNQLPPQDSSQAHKGSHEMKVKWCPVRETRLCLPQHGKGARRTWAFPWFFFFFINTSQFYHYFKNCQRTGKLRWKLFLTSLKKSDPSPNTMLWP